MSASTKLSTAVKALALLAQSAPGPLTSAEMSRELGLNASKLRQLLSMLSKAEMVESRQGTAGGFALARDPELIDLQEVYCAIEDRKAFHLDVGEGSRGTVSEELNTYFLELFSDIQVEIESKMKRITLRDILQGIHRLS